MVRLSSEHLRKLTIFLFYCFVIAWRDIHHSFYVAKIRKVLRLTATDTTWFSNCSSNFKIQWFHYNNVRQITPSYRLHRHLFSSSFGAKWHLRLLMIIDASIIFIDNCLLLWIRLNKETIKCNFILEFLDIYLSRCLIGFYWVFPCKYIGGCNVVMEPNY